MEQRSVFEGLKRGACGRCPNCGRAKLFARYLKVEPDCPACGHENGQYRADDAPPYFTILIVGHLVIAPLLVFPWIWKAPAWLVVGITLPLLFLLTVTLLPVVKGAVVGLHWATDTRRKPGDRNPNDEPAPDGKLGPTV